MIPSITDLHITGGVNYTFNRCSTILLIFTITPVTGEQYNISTINDPQHYSLLHGDFLITEGVNHTCDEHEQNNEYPWMHAIFFYVVPHVNISSFM